MRHSTALLLATLALCGPSSAWAYNGSGHAMVGTIADQLLEAGAAQQVQAILGMDLRTAANWADCVKAVQATPEGKPTSFVYQGKEAYRNVCGVFETPAEQAHMQDYVRRNWANCSRENPKSPCHAEYHYTDIAIAHDHYDRKYKGTSDHDVVSAIDAAIAVLRGKPAPKPFAIADKREALLLLAHFVGDVHQPLHVGSLYLGADDQPFDPDATPGALDTKTQTVGGNALTTGFDRDNLHSDWDEVSPHFDAAHPPAVMVDEARALAPSPGDVNTWAAAWASESVVAAQAAFATLSFSHEQNPGHWTTKFDNRRAYMARVDAAQTQLLYKGGARLAQLLNKVLTPDPGEVKGYLGARATPIEPWFAPSPAVESLTMATDVQAYYAARRYAGTARAADASRDDIYLAFDIAARFAPTLGKRLDTSTTPTLIAMMDRVRMDASAVFKPVKKELDQGGRTRPFVSFPDEFHCPIKYAKLAKSGSYPSTHAAMGWLWGAILAEIQPAKAGELLTRGIDFGDSRLVCGFHYPSDLAAGRLGAAALLVQLHNDPQFLKDLAAAKKELAKAP